MKKQSEEILGGSNTDTDQAKQALVSGNIKQFTDAINQHMMENDRETKKTEMEHKKSMLVMTKVDKKDRNYLKKEVPRMGTINVSEQKQSNHAMMAIFKAENKKIFQIKEITR